MNKIQYGIYLAYAPTVDLRHEGLGRYLAAFVKGATKNSDVGFVLVCPSWSKESLKELFVAESIPPDSIEIISPNKIPAILFLYEKLMSFKKRRESSSLFKRINNYISVNKEKYIEKIIKQIGASQGVGDLVIKLLPFLLLCFIVFPVIVIFTFVFFLTGLAKKILSKCKRKFSNIYKRVHNISQKPKDDGMVLKMFASMKKMEAERMQKIVEKLDWVRAWYSPTAFWPEFNNINKPRLICVPDVVLGDFPIGFSDIGGSRFVDNFKAIEKTIESGDYFVTYSRAVKFNTLVQRYSISPDKVHVINHAPNSLNNLIDIRGFSNNEMATINYCKLLVTKAVSRSRYANYASSFAGGGVKFIFYASQFRPNKNIITLLKAYSFLLKKEFIPHKLILTGNINSDEKVKKFIFDNEIENDVLCLHGLETSELAAFYKLADLAVNPSLSEGGCPFTFTEALSVETPVVMADIEVTREIISNENIQTVTFFDPYNWNDAAEKIAWALENREELLNIQKPLYEQLLQRSWSQVVNEHLFVLDKIAN